MCFLHRTSVDYNWLVNKKITPQSDRGGIFFSSKPFWLSETKNEDAIGRAETDIPVREDESSTLMSDTKYPTSQWDKILAFISVDSRNLT